MVLVAVSVAAVDHHLWSDARLLHLLAGGLDRSRIEVHGLATAAQDDMTVAIAFGHEDCGLAVLGVAEKVVRMASGQDCLDGDLYIARGPVFEAHGAGEARDQLAVYLALGGSGANCTPADKARDILRRDHVEELRPCGHAHLGEVEE